MYSSIGTNRLTTGFITPQLFHNRDHKEIWRLCFLLLIYLRLHDSFFILFRITYNQYVIFCTSRWSLLHKSYINTLYHQRRELCNSSDYFHQPLREHYTGKSHSKRLFYQTQHIVDTIIGVSRFLNLEIARIAKVVHDSVVDF